MTAGWQAEVEAARRGDDLVVLEGVHALKHAIRFGATIRRIGSPDPAALDALLGTLAPDVHLPVDVEGVTAATWESMTGGGLPSPALALADRPQDVLDDVLAAGTGIVVLLEHPTHLGNVGAVVRVAAAADAAGVLVVGSSDPWHARAVRGGAGLQFALPVGRRDELPVSDRPVVALDPAGAPIATTPLPQRAILVFGTERHGLSDDLLARADHRVALPMRPGVSSLNLATSVAAVLYGAMVGAPPAR
ncbi:TrmH family RNA methyltransferase [Salsipaludibacter albus]|uniref:TrmH family RNA methyltransferase n=1 Tax=Salsipaludibacter albus TaxID=2849650 RepID=UPI001EE3C301